MATTYAHYVFGQDCLKLLDANIQSIIKSHIDLYNFAVHGPDLFFYDLGNDEICKYGSNLHNVSGFDVFENFKKAYKNHEEKDEMLTYILGFFTHYILDSSIHSYVEAKKEYSDVSHNRIEADFDYYLIKRDGYDPLLYNRAKSLKPNEYYAKIISYFYPFTKEDVFRTSKKHKLIISCINTKTELSRKIKISLLKKLKWDKYIDLMFTKNENPKTMDSSLRLEKLFNKALKLYSKLVNNLLNFLEDKEELDEYFAHNFNEWDDYKELKILSYEEELKYEV